MIDFNKLTLSEALAFIDKDVTLLGSTFRFAEGSPLHQVFKCAFLPQYKFVLPEGNPPYTPLEVKPGSASCDLLVAIKRGRLDYFTPKMDVNPIKREQLFINLLETVDATEAKVVLAIKDQALTKMYPKITWEVLHKYGYLPEPPKPDTKSQKSEEVVEQPKKQPRRGRPRKIKTEEVAK